MLRFKRPRKPRGFDGRFARVRAEVDAAVARGEQASFDEASWRRYTPHFIRAQHSKCGYCETSSHNHPGALEHFAPKGAVCKLDEEGREVDGTARMEGRRMPAISSSGYYWLAYEWDNWLFACERCNSAHKCSLFPVTESVYPLPPAPNRPFTPLLLHPFGDEDPALHLRFDELGQVTWHVGSARGEATVRTCGLQRESLRRARQGFAEDANRHIGRLLAAMTRKDKGGAAAAIEDLRALGGKDRAHAGMVRCLVQTKLGITYEDLPKLLRRLGRRANRYPTAIGSGTPGESGVSGRSMMDCAVPPKASTATRPRSRRAR